MNYKLSKDILDKINSSERILVNCHRNADPDSVGSATALYQVLQKMDKDTLLISPDEPQRITDFIPFRNKVKVIDFDNFEFDEYDLFIILDSGSPQIVTGFEEVSLNPIEKIVIDHHKTNTINGESIRLLDPKSTSASEVLYKILIDWNVKLDKQIAISLFAGIIGDTGAFQYPKVGVETFKIAADLMSYGVNKDEIVMHIYRNEPFELLKFWGEVLKRMKIDKSGFLWSAVPYEVYEEFGSPDMGRRTSVERFGTLVEDTQFGIVMVEQVKNELGASFRSRTGFDTTKITKLLGGGGHIYASGCQIQDMEFDKAVELLLKTSRKVVKESKR